MAAIDVLKDLAPELVSQGDVVIARFIGYAQSRVNSNVWPASKVDQATALLAAHMMTVAGAKRAAGSVTSQRVGDLQQNFSAPTFQSTTQKALSATAYGLEFLALQGTIVTTPLLI